MQLTLFSDYALRMLMYLGIHRGKVVPIAEVADAFGVSRHYMLKVMNELVQLDYIEAVRGRGGGVKLVKRPGDVRIGKLIRRTEPDRGVLECLNDPGTDCPIMPACRLRDVLAEAQSEFYGVLDRYTLGDLIEDPERLRRLLRYPAGRGGLSAGDA